MHAANIVDITLENFQHIMIEASQEKLVIVDFWADWCEPCKDLLPILEKIAAEYSEQVILAKVDCEAQQQIAAQFGVRNLPTVALVKDGQPVDGFAGVQPEAQIREMLSKYLPKVEDTLIQQAQQLLAENQLGQALAAAQQAFELDGSRADIKFVLINILLECGKTEAADELLATITMVDQDATYQSLLAKLELAKQAAESPEILSLQAQLQADPDNLDLKMQLAVQYNQVNKQEEALKLVFGIVQGDLANADAKKLMLDIINALPDGDALASQYRRKLFSLMY